MITFYLVHKWHGLLSVGKGKNETPELGLHVTRRVLLTRVRPKKKANDKPKKTFRLRKKKKAEYPKSRKKNAGKKKGDIPDSFQE
jgi:hypothetical protein